MKSNNGSDLRSFFEPRSVAVIGSLSEPFGLGYVTIRNLLHFGYSGKIYPVNPSYSGALGLASYSDIRDVDEPVDTAVVITPPETVPGIVERCAQRGVKAVVIVSDNFAEAGDEGAELQRQLVDIARRTGIRIMGPNTIGLLNTSNGFTTVPYTVAYKGVLKGGIAYCGQSGFIGPTAHPLQDRAYPISKMCDVGNKCDVNEVDLLDYLVDDPETTVVAMHLEDVKDGRKFIDAARRLAASKPLLVLKSGRSEEGARASASHTGSLAGNEQVYDSAFRQCGAIRVKTWHEFWEVPKVLAYQPVPRGNRVAIITHSGGAGVVAVDTAVEAGLQVPRFSAETVDRLSGLYPRMTANPLDMGPALSVVADPFLLQEEAIVTVLDDPNIDCAATAIYVGFDFLIPVFVDMFKRLEKRISKPLVVGTYGMQLAVMEEMLRQMEGLGFPTYLEFDTAIKALGFAADYSRIKSNLHHDSV